jgi:NDP-sugar pyrophosphorylase family protein
VPPAEPCQFPELVLKLLAAGEHVCSFHSDVEWFDIGTAEEHQRAVEAYERTPEVFAT